LKTKNKNNNTKFKTVIEKNTFYFYNAEFQEDEIERLKKVIRKNFK